MKKSQTTNEDARFTSVRKKREQPNTEALSCDHAVAVDFGMAQTGVAHAFLGNEETDPVLIQEWPGYQQIVPKTLTRLLLRADNGHPEEWGKQAEQLFCKILDDPQNYRLCKMFKRSLYRDGREKRPLGQLRYKSLASDERSFNLLDEVIAPYFRLIFDSVRPAMEAERTSKPLDPENILYVFPLPANFQECDRERMRLAAIKAGLISDDIADQGRIAFPTEAECSILSILHESMTRKLRDLGPGTVITVDDMGGLTTQISTYEVTDDYHLKEILPNTTENNGSTDINNRFEAYLAKLFTAKAIKQFQASDGTAWYELMEAFEEQKCIYYQRQRCSIPFPGPFIDILKKNYQARFKNALEKKLLDPFRYRLRLDQRMEEFFRPILQRSQQLLAKHLQQLEKRDQRLLRNARTNSRTKALIKKRGVGKSTYLFLTGGLGGSRYVRSVLSKTWKDRVAYCPLTPDPFGAVAKGAIRYVQDPTRISERCSKFSYGIRGVEPFDAKSNDPEESKKEYEHLGGEWCKVRFRAFVRAGEQIPWNHKVSFFGKPVRRDQTEIVLGIYKSPNPDVQHTTETGVRRIGDVRLKLTGDQDNLNREIKITIHFGLTEFFIEAEDTETGKKVPVAFRYDH